MELKEIHTIIENELEKSYSQIMEELKKTIRKDLKNNYKYEVEEYINHEPYIKKIKKTNKKLNEQNFKTVSDFLDELTGENPHYSTSNVYYDFKYQEKIMGLIDEKITEIIENNFKKSSKELIDLMGKYEINYVNSFIDVINEINELPGFTDIRMNLLEQLYNDMKNINIDNLLDE